MASQEDGKTEALWRFLDLMLVAYALSCDIDAEIASFVMLPVLVVAERLALSDEALSMMRNSAVAQARKRRKRSGEPSCS